MKILKPIFLQNRLFLLLAAVFLLYCLAFSRPVLIMIGTALLVLAAILTLTDIILLGLLSRKIEGSRSVPRHFSMSDPNNITLTITNHSGHPLRIRLIDEIPAQFQERNFEINQTIKANDKGQLIYTLTPMTRGEHHFGALNIFISSRLGLASYRKVIPLEQMVKVFPSFIQMRLYELMVFSADSSGLGIKKTRKIGHGYEYSDIREYVTGDDTRAINWKASSRAGKMMVNNFEDEKAQQVYAVINKSRVMRMPFEGLSLMDYAINSTLAILNIALKNQDHAGLLTFSKETETFIPAGKRTNQLQLIQNALYNQTESQHEENYRALYGYTRRFIKRRSLLLLFTNFMSLNSLQRNLPEIKRINRSHLLIVIFFENTEIEDYLETPAENTLDICSKVMAEKLSEELTQVIYELRNAGIQAIKTRPKDLTTNTVNKYLELKSMGMI